MIKPTGESLRPCLHLEITRLSAQLYDAVDAAILFVSGVVRPKKAAAQ
jgi:hypothetical protein